MREDDINFEGLCCVVEENGMKRKIRRDFRRCVYI